MLDYNTILDILQSVHDCTRLDTIKFTLNNPGEAARIQAEQTIIDYTIQEIRTELNRRYNMEVK